MASNTMTSLQALRIAYQCARLYEQNFNGRKMLFIAVEKKELPAIALEVWFDNQQFRHLTGLTTKGRSAVKFYKDCLKQRIRLTEIAMDAHGSTEQKLKVLPTALSSPESFGELLADFVPRAGSSLQTDKLVVNSNCWSMGFAKYSDKRDPVPNTFLNEHDGRGPEKENQLTIIAAYQKRGQDGGNWEELYDHGISWQEGVQYPDDWGTRPRPYETLNL